MMHIYLPAFAIGCVAIFVAVSCWTMKEARALFLVLGSVMFLLGAILIITAIMWVMTK